MDAQRLLSACEGAGIDFFTGVPDSQLKGLCDSLYALYGVHSPRHIVAANEGNAIGLAAGHFLATGRPALCYMQNSGLGNAVNPLASLMDALAAAGRSVMAVDSTLPLPDKDFKALIQDGRIRRVGVDCFDAGSVECQAAYHWQPADFSSWMDEIERFVERGDVKCYAENAFNAVSGEIPLYPLECGGRLCAEIDNQADREVVLTRFRQEVL